MEIVTMYEQLGVSRAVYEYGEAVLRDLRPRFDVIDQTAEYNQGKVLAAMQKNRVNATHFAATTGYGYNDDGTLTSDDYRYASTTVTLRNLEDTAVPVWTPVLYDFALRNDDGTLDMVRTGYDLDFEATGDTVPSDDPQHVVIAPGGTVQLTMVRVLPTYVLESDNLVLVPTDNGSLFSHAFALGRQM